MKFFRITNGFDKMTDAYLLVRANFIRNRMGGNPNFPNPVPSMNDLNSTINSLEAATQNAESGNHQDIAIRNQVRQSLIAQLHLLGNFVLHMSGNNEVIATSSGFNISKQPEPKPAITVPEGLQLKNGLNKGELLLSFKRVSGARSYVYEITQGPVTTQSQWQTVMNTVSKNLFAGLESGKDYSCRVAAVGVKKQVVYSDAVSRIVL